MMSLVPSWSPDLSLDEKCKEAIVKPVIDEKACRAHYKLNPFDSYRSKIFFDFKKDQTGDFKKVDFKVRPGVVIRGLLGLQKEKKRPLVIFRMGIHGNRDEFLAERYLIRILFDDLGYHVLMLESLTSHGYIRSNDQVAIGGFEEAMQTLFVLNLIRYKKVEWQKDIASIHLMALSMGGAGVMLASSVDEQMAHQVKSVQLFCPLINLQQTFERMSQPGVFNAFVDYWNSQRLIALTEKFPKLQQLSLWPMLFDFKPRFALEVLNQFNQNKVISVIKPQDFSHHFPGFKFPQNLTHFIDQSHTLYEVNQFWKIFKNQSTPIQIIYTPNDPLVFNDLNVDKIMKGTQEGIFQKTSFMQLVGTHCALAEEYQWPYLVEIVRRQIEWIK